MYSADVVKVTKIVKPASHESTLLKSPEVLDWCSQKFHMDVCKKWQASKILGALTASVKDAVFLFFQTVYICKALTATSVDPMLNEI